MNREDIIRMAREVGFSEYHLRVLDQGIYRLADLVAAEEREACAKVCEDMGNIDGNMNKTWRNGCFDAAVAIRARGQA